MKSPTPSLFGIVILSLTLNAWAARSSDVCGTWSPSPTPNPSAQINRFSGVAAISPSDAWAVGWYDTDLDPIFELDRSLIGHWNGSSWSLVASPIVGVSGTVLNDVAAIASNDVWAVGYSSDYGTPQTLAMHWNGSAWSVIPSPVVTGGSGFESIAALSSTDIWAVGYRAGGMPEFTTTTGTMIAHWDGRHWTEVPSPNIGHRHNELVSVAAIAANEIWAVGTWRNIGENFQTLTEHWNGSSWTIVPSPNPSIENDLSAVAGVAGNDVWAIGMGNDGVLVIPLFFHWNGSAWSVDSSPGAAQTCTGCMGDLVTLASDDAWAVGNNIAHWDGTSWSVVPNPVVPGAAPITLNSVDAISACDAWAVGHAAFPGGPQTLAVRLSNGGASGPAGVDPGGAGLTRIVDVVPNPARAEAAVVFELARPQQATLRLFDLNGRLVATVVDGHMNGGRQTLSLGADVPAMRTGGLYFLLLSSGGVTSSRKFVVLE